ncbi:LAME_0E01948g1_1 [Lachancea meyersii CBS 8951]|uniref:Nucleoporin NUP188 n=1 Tax=Lachancea meyersii CBS 8951 TaxID=1266667 RepID=A0A1G4JFH3_9SACH|nr:LAME_0E01948g1_1 [Lachancea meyersii CBS 8951]
MEISHLCFGDVCDFIRTAGETSGNEAEVHLLISQFLKDYHKLLLAPGSFNEPGAEIASKTAPLTIGTIKYDVSAEVWKDASQLARFLGVSHEQALRVVSQANSRCFSETNRNLWYAERILQERLEVVETLLALLNSDSKTLEAKETLIKTISGEKSTFCLHLITTLSKLASTFAGLNRSDRLWSQEIQDYKNSQDLIYALSILRLLPLLIINSDTPVGIVTQWFSVLKETEYFSSFLKSGASNEAYDHIEALMTCITVLMLGLEISSFSINTDAPFFEDVDCFKHINTIVSDLPQSPLITYYWSFVISLKAYLLEEEPEKNAKFVNDVFGVTSMNNLTSCLVRTAEESGVLEKFVNFSNSLQNDKLWLTVLSSLLAVSLNFISMTKDSSKTIRDVLKGASQEFIERFLTNPEAEKKTLLLRSKVPLVNEGLLPLIYLTSVHPEFATFEWKEMNTYTEKLRLSGISYDLAESDGSFAETSDFIVLKQELLVKPPFECDENVLMPIPKGTRGKIVPTSSTSEDAIVFMYSYNGWSLLGRVVQSICETYTQSEDDANRKNGKSELVVAIIDLISSAVSVDSPIERSTEVLQHLSGYVESGDIISVLFKLFEQALHWRDMDVINAGIGLMIELLPNFPHFVWSHLARSSLIGRGEKESLAISILAGTGRTSANFDSIYLLIKLMECLVSEALNIEETFSERIKMEILENLMTHMIRIYEGFQFQHYSLPSQRSEIGLLLTSLITKVLYAVYGVDPDTSSEKKVTAVLASSATVAVTAFLSPSPIESRAVASLITILTSINNNALGHRNLTLKGSHSQLIEQSFNLANLLISIRSLLNISPSAFEKCIFSRSADLVNVYFSRLNWRLQIIKLFTHLVRAPWDLDPPSLLSYLGADRSRLLLSCIAYDLKGPLTNVDLTKGLYSFFSAIMEGKQDGLAVLFLTGNLVTVGEVEEKGKTENTPSDNLLAILKHNALQLNTLRESVSTHLLDAIAYALNTWTAVRGYENDAKFLSILVERLEAFKPQTRSEIITRNQSMELSNQYKVVSRITEILALALFTTTTNTEVLLKALSRPDLASNVKKVFQVDGYDSQLQGSLGSRFKSLWPRIELSMFITSPLLRSSKSFYTSIFDIPLMDLYFSQDEKWIGGETSKGFREEVIAASINLQLVTNQISAAKSWGALLTSFIKKTPTPLNDNYLTIASDLLETEPLASTNAADFTDLYLARIELSFYILYSCLQTKKEISDQMLKSLILSAMGMMKSERVRFLESVSQSSRYFFYRPLLRIVLIILSLVKDGKLFVESLSDHLIEFFELTLGKGANVILTNVLSEIASSVSHGKKPIVVNLAERIQDLLLLLSLFTKIKDLNPPNDFLVLLASSMNESGIIKTILNVYSSSHLLSFEEEPVLCDLSLTFLTEMCTVKDVAEKLIANGLFSVILESPVSVVIQQGKVNPEVHSRLHALWSDGLLTITLQILSKFGRKVLPECCLFVSYFGHQIESAISQWSDPSLSVSMSLIKETSQLIVLQNIFATLDYQDYLTDSNIRTKVINDDVIYELFSGLDTLAERKELSYSFKHLLTHPKYLNSRIVPTTLEEQRILEEEDTRTEFVKRITHGIKGLNSSLFSAFA